MFRTVNVIGIGDAIISNQPMDILKTYALSTCVAVTAFCPITHTAGMIHIALPSPLEQNTEEAFSIYRYASTGIPHLFDRLRIQFGCLARDMIIQIYGGAISSNEADCFRIGPKNVEKVKYTLAHLNAGCHYEDIGGNRSRTIEMNVSDGRVKVTTMPLVI